MTIRKAEEMIAWIDHMRMNIHDRLAGAYLTLTRPITEAQRTEMLDHINGAMADLRGLEEQSTQLRLLLARTDNDLHDLVERVLDIRHGDDRKIHPTDDALESEH